MDKAIFTLFDRTANAVLADAQVLALSIEGAYAKSYREDPSPRGLNSFMTSTATVGSTFYQLAVRDLQHFQAQSMLLRTAIDPVTPDAPETLQIAAQQLRNVLESLRLLAARRFRAALVGRLSMAPPSRDSLRVMNRAGQSIKADAAFYLTARKAAIDIFNEGQIAGLAAQGLKVAHVFTLDPESEISGAPVLIDESLSGLPAYSEIQESWFHPRSNAVLVGSL